MQRFDFKLLWKKQLPHTYIKANSAKSKKDRVYLDESRRRLRNNFQSDAFRSLSSLVEFSPNNQSVVKIVRDFLGDTELSGQAILLLLRARDSQAFNTSIFRKLAWLLAKQKAYAHAALYYEILLASDIYYYNKIHDEKKYILMMQKASTSQIQGKLQAFFATRLLEFGHKVGKANERPIGFKDKFKPGETIDLCIKFKKYKTIRKSVTVIPGEGPFVVSTRLIPLKRYEFSMRNNSKEINGIEYPYKLYVKVKNYDHFSPVESHHIRIERGVGRFYWTIYVDRNIDKLRLYAGYYYNDKRIDRLRLGMGRLGNIDIKKFINHFKHLAYIHDHQTSLDMLKSTLNHYYKIRHTLKKTGTGQLEELIVYVKLRKLVSNKARVDQKKILHQLFEIGKSTLTGKQRGFLQLIKDSNLSSQLKDITKNKSASYALEMLEYIVNQHWGRKNFIYNTSINIEKFALIGLEQKEKQRLQFLKHILQILKTHKQSIIQKTEFNITKLMKYLKPLRNSYALKLLKTLLGYNEVCESIQACKNKKIKSLWRYMKKCKRDANKDRVLATLLLLYYKDKETHTFLHMIPKKSPVIPSLIQVLQTQDNQSILEMFARMKTFVLADLVKLFHKTSSDTTKRKVKSIFQRMTETITITELQEYIQKYDPQKTPDALTILKQLITTSDWSYKLKREDSSQILHLRNIIAHKKKHRKCKYFIMDILQLIASKDWRIQSTVEYILHSKKTVMKALLEKVRTGEKYQRENAALALTIFGKYALPELINLLKGSEKIIIKKAVAITMSHTISKTFGMTKLIPFLKSMGQNKTLKFLRILWQNYDWWKNISTYCTDKDIDIFALYVQSLKNLGRQQQKLQKFLIDILYFWKIQGKYICEGTLHWGKFATYLNQLKEMKQRTDEACLEVCCELLKFSEFRTILKKSNYISSFKKHIHTWKSLKNAQQNFVIDALHLLSETKDYQYRYCYSQPQNNAIEILLNTQKLGVIIFVEILKNNNSQLEETDAAIYALSKMNPPIILPKLNKILVSKATNRVKQNTIKVIRRFGKKAKSSIPILIKYLRIEDLQVVTINALGEMKEFAKPAVDTLIKLTKSENYWVRSAAKDALRKIQK